MKQYGTSYYYASLFFPKKVKQKVVELYRFVRIPDLIVDDKDVWSDIAKTKLQQMREDRSDAYNNRSAQHPIRWNASLLFHKNHIPFRLSHEFWQSMLQDTEKKTYETYGELQEYMNGSAMVVGEMMCYALWEMNMDAIPYARKLGEAMQMTNFLRDVKEDRQDFWRIYMPLEDLHKFWLSPRHIKEFCITNKINENREKFMAYEIQRCDTLYDEALHGLKFLPKESKKAIYLSAKLYQQILRRIEHLHYNVFDRSARTTKSEKLMVLVSNIGKKV
jgi:15-cis-phytoene synthase